MKKIDLLELLNVYFFGFIAGIFGAVLSIPKELNGDIATDIAIIVACFFANYFLYTTGVAEETDKKKKRMTKLFWYFATTLTTIIVFRPIFV